MESPEGSETAVRQQRVYCIIASTVSPLRRSLQIEHALPVTAIGAVRYTATEDWSFLGSPPHDRSTTPGTVGDSDAGDPSVADSVLSIVLIMSRAGLVLYTLATMVQYIAGGRLSNAPGNTPVVTGTRTQLQTSEISTQVR
jgi:hypothetical protein